MHPGFHASMHPCIHASMHASIDVCIHTCICIHIHMYMHMYIVINMVSLLHLNIFFQILNFMYNGVAEGPCGGRRSGSWWGELQGKLELWQPWWRFPHEHRNCIVPASFFLGEWHRTVWNTWRSHDNHDNHYNHDNQDLVLLSQLSPRHVFSVNECMQHQIPASKRECCLCCCRTSLAYQIRAVSSSRFLHSSRMVSLLKCLDCLRQSQAFRSIRWLCWAGWSWILVPRSTAVRLPLPRSPIPNWGPLDWHVLAVHTRCFHLRLLAHPNAKDEQLPGVQ